MCKERSEELKEFLEERRYCMLYIFSLCFSLLLSLRFSRPSIIIYSHLSASLTDLGGSRDW